VLPWYLNWRVYFAAIVVACAVLLFYMGGSKPREEAKELRAENRAVSESNEISRSTQRRTETEGYETQRKAREDDRALRAGADPAAAPADDGGMRVAQRAYDEAIRASCRLRRASACHGAAGPGEHD
jgi:hypothetical protein